MTSQTPSLFKSTDFSADFIKNYHAIWYIIRTIQIYLNYFHASEFHSDCPTLFRWAQAVFTSERNPVRMSPYYLLEAKFVQLIFTISIPRTNRNLNHELVFLSFFI